MHIRKFSPLLFAVLLCLLMSARAQAQGAYGYSSLTFDDSTNTLTGYATTDLDYETAYYYDAQIDARIEDENGNVLGTGSGVGNPSAFTIIDVFEALLCVRFTIIGTVIVTPRFLGCNSRRFDPFGFSDLFDDYFWDYGDFFGSRRTRCIIGRLIFIGTIISDIIRCLPANVTCTLSRDLLPSGLSLNEKRFIQGFDPNIDSDHMTISCRATTQFPGGPISGMVFRFGFNDIVIDDGGHQNHTGRRPKGSFSQTVVRTNSNGEVQTVYTAPQFGGSTEITIVPQGAEPRTYDIFARVPGLQELPPPEGNAGYILTGSSEEGNTQHPNGHYGTPQANAGLQAIAAEYRDTFFPGDQFPNGVPRESALNYNDQSLRLGGKFDVTGNFNTQPSSWQTRGPHQEHKVGINCDVADGNIPNDQVNIGGRVRNRWDVMEDIFCRHGSTHTNREHCHNHWHLRFEFGTTGCNETNTCPRRRRAASNNLTGHDGFLVASVPGQVEAENFDPDDDDGAGSFAPDSQPAGRISYDYVQVRPVPGNEDNSYVPTSGGQWMSYTVNVASSGSYTFTAKIASAYSWNTFHVEIDDMDVTGPVYIPNTGSWSNYQFASFENFWLEAGPHIVTIVIDGAGPDKGNLDSFTISPYTPPYICDPQWWEINDCQMGGGYWDYDLCNCNYGRYYYY
jgi:hypothetical protein